MRKMQNRAIICLLFAVVLVTGIVIYIYNYVRNADQWIAYPANSHIYTKGKLTTGTIKDSNGETLIANNSDGGMTFNDSLAIRQALVHVTGDKAGNISTGANIAFANQLVGYNRITGLYSADAKGRTINLTVNSKACVVADEALAGRKGTVGVYNYKTGEIVCMVSSPNYDPYKMPDTTSKANSGIYLNRFLSSSVVPGSIFKTITATAALAELEDVDNFTYTCTGSEQYGSYSKDKVTCYGSHGTVDLEGALAKSCNCYFGKLADKIGKSTLKKYVDKSGLTTSYNIDGIRTKESSFTFSSNDLNLAWTGIGQYEDLVNPCSMMVYMGAVANSGKAAEPYLIKNVEEATGMPVYTASTNYTGTLIEPDIANKLASMMRNNVESSYGDYRFPGLEVYAKTGTAEGSKVEEPHAWMTGFLKDPDNPYAFIVLVENGGIGVDTAAGIVNDVLQSIVK